MSKTLVIVESFAKSKKIQQFLGNDYIVLPSFGHINQLDDEKFNRLGIDIQNNFKPIYTLIKDKRNIETVEKLKKVAKDCNKILICSDPDREGEIIGTHLSQLLLNSVSEKNRCVFNEITPSAIKEAIKNPRTIDMNMVYSGQSRQVLDKVTGYDLSPVLWKYVAPKLSAGRVQSVALKMVVEKEKQVESFENSASFKTYGTFFFKENKNIHASLNSSFENVEKAKTFLQNILNNNYRFIVSSIDKIKVSKNPPAPFITSTIQQEAGCRFKISPKKVMGILQKLYEHGKITYHRSDSVTLSNDALQNIKEYILDNFGADYHSQRQYKNKEGSQQGHEAIRPSYITNPTLPENEDFDKLERKMYELIWKRTIASQMAECVSEIHTLKIMIEKYDPYAFIAKSEQIIFDGYRKIYDENYDGKKEKEDDNESNVNEKNIFENVKVGTVLKMKSIHSIEKAKQPIPRYSEAFLIKNLEKNGIGRPSTYATTIETLLDRKYVEIRDIEGKVRDGVELIISDKAKNTNVVVEEKVIKIKVGEEKKKMVPTSIGRTTCEFLEKHFPQIMDYNFTSQMEGKLDEIANGKHIWYEVVREYYNSFHPTVEQLLDKNNSGTAKKMKNDRKRLLGVDGNNRNVYAYVAKYGSVYQVGEDNETDKKFVKIESPHSFDTVTIDDYLLVAKYPKLLGQYASETGVKDIFLKKGPYGFYFTYDNKNYPATNEDCSLENAISSIVSKQNINNNSEETPTSTVSIIKELGKYIVKNGKYGPYVQYDKTIAKIPKSIVAGDITKEMCKELIDKAKSVSKEGKKKKQYYASSKKKDENSDDD
jgi:DNA topoisomerase-1